MMSAQIRCVVGIDVAKDAHVVCALEAPSGVVRQRATRIAAAREGYAQLVQWLQTWGKSDTLLIGLEATGVL
jgi:transposase